MSKARRVKKMAKRRADVLRWVRREAPEAFSMCSVRMGNELIVFFHPNDMDQSLVQDLWDLRMKEKKQSAVAIRYHVF